VPATVVMIPLGVTSQITLFAESAMRKSPWASTATNVGSLSEAAVAAPPSPELPDDPLPVAVKIVPAVGAISRVCTLLTDTVEVCTVPAATTSVLEALPPVIVVLPA
jgi:hypothetical protein